jgi:uncharacterized protein YydD (DUF2326 family)
VLLNERRGALLQALNANRALEQFTLIDRRLGELRERSIIIRERLAKINEIETASTQNKIDRQLTHKMAVEHYNERQVVRDVAVRLFNEASTALYATPGDLLIDVGKEGFKFSYKIERKESKGVTNAAIFCYDVALAELWAGRSGLNTVWHDSILYDPIEERQVAKAIEYAARKSEYAGFQYVCLLNSDRLPTNEFSSGFDVRKYIVLTLSDRTESDGLLGIRF